MEELNQLSLERRLLIVSETIRLIESAFIHWDDAVLHPNELKQTTEMFFEKAVAAESRTEFQKVMWELFGRLNNAHSRYIDRLVQAPTNGIISFSMVELGGKWMVSRDITNSMQKGDIVLSIQGKQPLDWCKELGPYIGIANQSSQRIRLTNTLSWFIPDSIIEVVIEDRNHSRRTVLVPRLNVNDERLRNSTQTIDTEGKWLLDGKVAYVHIPGFGEPKYEERALGHVKEFRNAPALIIDIRGNGGGSTPSRLTKQLMDRPYRWWMERARHPELLWKRHGNIGEIRFGVDYSFAEWHPNWREPEVGREHYNGRLILLTDRYVGSAAEDFVMPFKDNGRATIVGERTWGSTGQPISRQFGDDIQTRIGSIRAYFPNGDPFEGIGITPDVEITYTRDDIYENRDVILEKALELLE